MHTKFFYAGLEAGMSKEAIWGKLWATGGNTAQGLASAGRNLWQQTASKAVPDAANAGIGAFGSMAGKGWGEGMAAFRNARLSNQGLWDATRQGLEQGAGTFNSMYRALSPEAQKRIGNIGRGVGYTGLFGGGALTAGALV